ncbi:MAG: hypothetical protein WC332_07090 [Clostridia bacterium]|jgi:hypothetical protein
MKSKYRKSLSIIMILVILVSHSIIPVSASSDYYESTYNGYSYICRSEFYPNGCVFSHMDYAGTNKIRVEIEYSYYDYLLNCSCQENAISPLKMSTTCTGASFNEYQIGLWSNNVYTISPNMVYSVGLN